MPTLYEAKVEALKDQILDALQTHAEPSACGLYYLAAAAPLSVVDNAIAKPPSAAESALLSNGLLATVLHLANEASKRGVVTMALHLSSSTDKPDAAAEPSASLLLDSALWLASQTPAALDLGMPASCVECLVEAVTNAECDGVLAYLDSRLAQFKAPALMQRSHHTLLRTCTLLLRRLSKSHDASLCGRVLLFLAKFLPLTERSGVNFLGAFHTDNTTPVEQVEEGALDAEGKPVDREFYTKFWGLQRWFANPPSALPAAKWSEVYNGVRAVLDRFAKENVTVTEASPRGIGIGIGIGIGVAFQDSKDLGEGASVKYLSSARLLPLQLRDATFRRQFLIQVLILMQWVEKPLLKEYTSQAAKDTQLEDLQSLRRKVYSALEATPERGREFTSAVRALMTAEDTWTVWKQAGCPKEPLEVRPAAPPAGIADADVAPPPKRPRPSSECIFGIRVGTQELDRLWNLTEDNTSTLSAEDRGGFRSLRQLMEPVIEEMQEAAAGGDEEDQLPRASANAIYSWKTLRVVSKHSLPAFAASVRRGGDLTVAARALYPDEVPPEPVVTEAETETDNKQETKADAEPMQQEGAEGEETKPVGGADEGIENGDGADNEAAAADDADDGENEEGQAREHQVEDDVENATDGDAMEEGEALETSNDDGGAVSDGDGVDEAEDMEEGEAAAASDDNGDNDDKGKDRTTTDAAAGSDSQGEEGEVD